MGAGPAGAQLATLLASAGREVLLFDPKGAWEKPCGGGVTSRALREFAFLLQTSGYPKKLIRRIRIVSPNRSEVMLEVDEPFAVYSRQVLNGLVLDRAIGAGARFVQASVTAAENDRGSWRLTSEAAGGKIEQFHAQFLVGADGAASSTRRRLIGIFPKRDLALAFGYNVIDPQSDSGDEGGEAVVRFPVDFTGYLWAFPRPGVMNFGVASKLGERTSEDLRSLLAEFVRDHYSGRMPAAQDTQFFGAKIPTLDAGSWGELQTIGDGWALIGDAAGFCDPITGEGIYYALKSAEILAKSLTGASPSDYRRATADYEKYWREEFGRELSRASQILPRFYRGYIFGQLFTDAMVRLSKFHQGTSKILLRALIGDQSYVTLKQDLLRNAWRVL